MSDDDRDRDCPACDSSLPGEWDPVLRVFVCPVCAKTWRRRQRDDEPAQALSLPRLIGRWLSVAARLGYVRWCIWRIERELSVDEREAARRMVDAGRR